MADDYPKAIAILHRKMVSALNVRMEEIGLSSPKSVFLMCLYQSGTITQADLCRKLDLDKGAVAKALCRLESDGFVTKCANPQDVRSCLVSLTDKAYAVIPEIERIQQAWFEALTSGMTDVERNAFSQLLLLASERAASLCDE